MKSKYILFTAPNTAEFLEDEVAAPVGDQVQVRLCVSTISSGTERALCGGELNINPNKLLDTAVFPRSSGYSSSGIVEAVGDKVTTVKPGDRVVLYWSSHRSVQNLPEQNVLKIGDNISFEEAALFHIATFPLIAFRKCRLEIGESAIVMGMGVLGMLALPLLKAAGAAPLIAADPIPEKRARALELGADYALDPYDPDFAKTVKEITDGGANVAIEVTGFGKALDGVLDCMAKFGRVALLGCTRHSDFTIDYYHKVHSPGIVLIGAHTQSRPKNDTSSGMWTARDDMKALIRLTSCGRLDLGKMVEETHSPEEAPEMYTRLCTNKTFPLVQFDWRNIK